MENNERLNLMNRVLSRRTMDLAANWQLQEEIRGRRVMERALKRSEDTLQPSQSLHMQEQLRRGSHQILSAHEEERREISRELAANSRTEDPVEWRLRPTCIKLQSLWKVRKPLSDGRKLQ